MEQSEEDTGVRNFYYGRVTGAYGVAWKEWGIGASVKFGEYEHLLFSARFQFGPLWLDAEVLKRGWS